LGVGNRKKAIKAVHDDDLVVFVKGLGIYLDCINNKLSCDFCEDVITVENLHAIFPDSGAIKVSKTISVNLSAQKR
jgi:hypothetical protein